MFFPTRNRQRGRIGQQHQHAKHYKNMAPSPQWHRKSIDQGGGSGQLRLRAGGAKTIWVKKSRRSIKRYKPKIVKVDAPTTAYSKDDINSFYNDVDKTLGKLDHFTIVMGDITNRDKNKPYGNGNSKFGTELRIDRGDTLVEWATSKKYNIMNIMFQKKTGRRWTWESPSGVTKTELDYILTNRPDIVTDITVINQVNIRSDHRMDMSNIKLDAKVESKQLMSKKPPSVDTTQIGST